MSRAKGPAKTIQKLFIGMLLGANLCTLMLLWISVLSTYFPADDFPRISLLGLAFPIFLGINIAFCILWIIFHIRLIWVPLVGMLLVSGFIWDYCPLNMKQMPQESDSLLSIMSFNAGWMKTEEDKIAFTEYLKHTHPDIICIQELGYGWHNLENTKRWRDSMGYHEMTSLNKTIYSRLPIIGDSVSITYPTRSNGSLGCWIDLDGDSLLVISNHLESNHLTEDETTEYQEMIKNPGKERIQQSGHTIGSKLREAAYYRGCQTDTMCAIVERNAGKHIIMCGDYNDTPISYTYQKLLSHLDEAFRKGGHGPGFSFKLSGFYIRIDHVFFSNQFECEYTCIDHSLNVSDHYPIITYLRKKNK